MDVVAPHALCVEVRITAFSGDLCFLGLDTQIGKANRTKTMASSSGSEEGRLEWRGGKGRLRRREFPVVAGHRCRGSSLEFLPGFLHGGWVILTDTWKHVGVFSCQ